MGHFRKFDFADHADETLDERTEANRQTASLAGLAIALFLVVAGLFIFRELHAEAVLEDCLMSGQRSCGVIVSTVM
jgi:predicted metal-binding membrane protein